MKLDMYVKVKVIDETEHYCQFLITGEKNDLTITLSYAKDSDEYRRMIDIMNSDKPIKLEGEM